MLHRSKKVQPKSEMSESTYVESRYYAADPRIDQKLGSKLVNCEYPKRKTTYLAKVWRCWLDDACSHILFVKTAFDDMNWQENLQHRQMGLDLSLSALHEVLCASPGWLQGFSCYLHISWKQSESRKHLCKRLTMLGKMRI